MVKLYSNCFSCGFDDCRCPSAAVPPSPDRSSHFARALWAIWFLGWVITFGHEAARFSSTENNPSPGGTALICGAIWPVYWPFRLSWDYFNPEPPR
jgi:hypothetical protein